MAVVRRVQNILKVSLGLLVVPILAWPASWEATSDDLRFVAPASAATAASGVMLLLVLFGGPVVAGRDRSKMSTLFGPWLRSVMALIALSMFLQAALFIYTNLVLRTHDRALAPPILLAAVGIAGLFICWTLAKSAIAVFKSQPVTIRGCVLERAAQPRLYEFVDEIAAALGAERPDFMIAGLEPTFFVTAADVQVLGQGAYIRGKTLFISLCMLRLLERRELAAIVGHELGHFRGDDVVYSKKFAPIYGRLGESLQALSISTHHWLTDLVKRPAIFILSMCLLEFAGSEREVRRKRELEADRAAVEATDAATFARALVKITLMGPVWGLLSQAQAAELGNGNLIRNVPLAFVDVCTQFLGQLDWGGFCAQLGLLVQPHPVDTHPTLAQRLAEFDTSLESILPSDLYAAPTPATLLLDDIDRLEATLSHMEAAWLLRSGAASLPKGSV